MRTPRYQLVKEVSGTKPSALELKKSHFYYFGIQSTIEKYKKIISASSGLKEISLVGHVDGIDVEKSTGFAVWPILGKILGIPENVIFPIALYTGSGKPPCTEEFLQEFLQDFVDEVINLSETGITLNETMYKFKLIRMLGDAPARCLFLNIHHPNAYGLCLYSDVWGEHLCYRVHFYVSEEERSFLEKRNVSSIR